MKQKLKKINESQLKQVIRESIKKVLKEASYPQYVRFNWNITVPVKHAQKIYKLQSQLESAKWVSSFERDEEPVEMQHLSVHPGKINENDFTPHGYSVDSNFGGQEIELSDDGSMARFRQVYGDKIGEPTDWLEIEFDENGVAYVKNGERVERLDMYMKY